MTCNIQQLRKQLQELQLIADDFHECQHNPPDKVKQIREDMRQECIDALDKNMSQSPELMQAIEVINGVK